MPNAGVDVQTDSDANQVTGKTTVITLGPAEKDYTWDAGLVGNPAVRIKKFTNGSDADDPNGADVPIVAPGAPVTWLYEVTNTGNVSVPASQVVVTDSTTGVVPVLDSTGGDSSPASFDAGDVWFFKATGTALDLTLPAPDGATFVSGVCTHNGKEPPRTAYVNVGRVTIPGGIFATDPSSYCNEPPPPGVTIVKYTNTRDANDPNGSDVPNIPIGGDVTWTYKVTNTGQTAPASADVVVTDDHGVTLTFTSELSGNADMIFNPGEVWLYTGIGQALDLSKQIPDGILYIPNSCTADGTQGPRTAYQNLGTVTIPGATASDPSSYCNPPTPGVTIVKYTNEADANDPNAAGVPNIAVGDPVTWTYKVTNTGQTAPARAEVVVTDDHGVVLTFTSVLVGNVDTVFNPGEVWLYTGTGTALDLSLQATDGVKFIANSCTAGGTQTPRTAYKNRGTVTIPGDSATDPSSYCNPPAPGVTIARYTNGEDANDPDAADVPEHRRRWDGDVDVQGDQHRADGAGARRRGGDRQHDGRRPCLQLRDSAVTATHSSTRARCGSTRQRARR